MVRAGRLLAVIFTATLVLSLVPAGTGRPAARAQGTPVPAAAHQYTPLVPAVLAPPRWFVGSDERIHLVYELMLTNAFAVPVELTAVEVLDAATGQAIATLEGDALAAATSLLTSPTAPTTSLPPATVGVVWSDVLLSDPDSVPAAITHRLTVAMPPGLPVPESITSVGGEAEVDVRPPVVLAPPLAGSRWVAAGSCCDGPHRRSVQAIDGGLHLAQRFAIDFNQLDAENRISAGDPKLNTSYPGYGQPVFAVADAAVVAAVDRYPDQIATETTGVTLENAEGNHVILDLGDGRFAFYAHLKPGSVAVRTGERVQRGQIIGELGNSGSSTGPHLHFHVMDAPSALIADGLPYVFDGFELTGQIPPLAETMAYVEAQEPLPIDAAGAGPRRDVLPLGGNVLAFPAASLPPLATPSVQQTPAAAPITDSSAALAWQPCAGGNGWECASLPVPLDYADPGSQTIDIAVTRLPASDPARRIGALLVNCGGPGCPTVTILHQLGTALFPEETRARFDIVGFDPRGVGASGRIDCRPDFAAWYALDPSPDDDAEWEIWLAAGRAFADACAANGGPLLPFLGTENVVSDMERLREALGEETISFLGLSYGTSIGARYADRYPDRVRAFALDSALPSFVDPATFVTEWVDAIERAFDAYLADCAAALTCAFHSGGDPGAAFDALMAHVDAAPLEVVTEDGVRLVGQRAILDAVDAALSWRGRWPELATALAAADAGDGTAILAMADGHNERLPDGSYGPGNTAFLAVGCLDFSITNGPAAYQALAAKAARIAPRLGAYYATWTLPCVFWPAPPTPADHPPVAAGAPPILVVGATLDTQDAYSWSVDMAAQLASGILLRRDGTWHPSYWNSACVADAVNAYLLELTLPPADLICPSTGGLFA
jgi:pimeloyl-ACP methyl ester carboxylesterase